MKKFKLSVQNSPAAVPKYLPTLNPELMEWFLKSPLSESISLDRNTRTSLLPDTFSSSSRCGRCQACGVVPRPGVLSLPLGLLPMGHTLTLLRRWPGGVQVSRWHHTRSPIYLTGPLQTRRSRDFSLPGSRALHPSSEVAICHPAEESHL